MPKKKSSRKTKKISKVPQPIKEPKIPYVMQKETFDRNTINNFYSDEIWRRKIRKGNVSKFISLLRNGKHFASPFVVNEVNGEKKIIDGNHRFEAIKELLGIEPNFLIKVWIARYNDLDAQGERDAFADWNLGTRQSSDDFLKIYWDTIPNGKEILELIPCSIYGAKTKLQARVILGNHIMEKKQNKYLGDCDFGPQKIVPEFQKITLDDIKTVSAFVKDFVEIAGPVDTKGSHYWKQTPVSAFYRIWFDNKITIPHNKFIKLMRDKVLFSAVRNNIIESTKGGGRGAGIILYELLLAQMKSWEGRYGYKDIKVVRYVPKTKKSTT